MRDRLWCGGIGSWWMACACVPCRWLTVGVVHVSTGVLSSSGAHSSTRGQGRCSINRETDSLTIDQQRRWCVEALVLLS